MRLICTYLLVGMSLLFSVACEQKKKETPVVDSGSTAPTSYTASISINSGATLTNLANVNLTIGSTPTAAEMYITQDPSCTAGGAWEAYSASKVWPLGNMNAANTIYVTVRDSSVSSSCVSASITHDNTAPTANSISINTGNTYTSSLAVNLTLASTGAYQMYITDTAACASGGVWESYSAAKAWNLPLVDQANTVYAKFRDEAGNETACESDSIIHDSQLPVLTVTSPALNSYVNAAGLSAFTVSGACSANGQNVVITGSFSQTTTCSGGAWSVTQDISGLAEGNFSINVNHSNALGNPAPQVTAGFIKDTVAPTGNSISINSGATATNSTSSTLTLASTGAATMYVTPIAGCASGGTSENYATSKAWTLTNLNATNTVYVKYTDAAGNTSACINASIIHDSVAPTVAITSPAANSNIWSGNVTAFTVSGTCSENARTVSLTGAVTASATCSSGTWSSTANYTAASEGTATVTATHLDAAGNSATNSRNFNKDVTPPGSPSIVLNSGATTATSPTMAVTLSATSATDMYITEDSSCTTGGSWVTYATSSTFDITQGDGYVYLYVKFRDTPTNETACVSASIIIDSTPPLWTDSPIHSNANSSTTSSPLVLYDESASDADSGVQKYQYAIGTSQTGANQANIKTWTDVSGGFFTASGLTLTNGTTYYVNMRVLDYAGNEAYVSSAGWLVDNVPPTLTLSSHSNNQFISESDIKLVGSCESPYVVNLSFGSDMSGDASVACTSNTFIAYASFSGTSGTRSYSISQTDGSSNTTTLNLNFNYQTPVEIGGTVLATLQLSDGSAIYGGTFQSVTTTREMRLVRLNSDGTKDTAFEVGSGFNGQVLAMAEMADGSVIVGGDFTTYRSRPAYRIAKISSTGVLDSTFSPTLGSNGFNGIVRAIGVMGTSIYVGGDFTSFKGSVANRIAKISDSGVLDTTFNPASGANGANNRIRGISVDGTTIYIGGDFTTYKGGVANRIAKLDSAGNLDLTFSPASGANGVNGIVRALASFSGTVYAGGDFTTFKGSPANRIAKLDSSGALDLTFNPASGNNGVTSSSTYVSSIAISGTDVYLAGSFTKYRGTNANRIARVTASTGALNTTFNPTSGNNGANNVVSGVAVLSGNIYFGGLFTTYKAANSNRIAKVNSSGTLDTTFSPASGPNGFNNTVNTVLSTSSKIYVGGYFGNYRAGTVAKNIVKITSAGAVDTTFSPQAGANGFDNTVRALATDGTAIYVGGDFLNYRGVAAVRLMKIDSSGTKDATLETGAPYGFNGIVRALYYEPTENMIYAGGDFTSWAGNLTNRIAKMGASGDGLDATTFNPATGGNGTNGSVYTITGIGTDLYLGGSFTTYRGTAANRVARIALTGVLNTTFSPTSGANGFNSTVYALTNDGTDIYAGGAFTTFKGTVANRIAKVSSSGALNTTFGPTSGANGFNSYVYALDYLSGSVYAGGSFTRFKSSGIANYITKISTAGVIDTTFSPQTGANGTSGGTPTVYSLSVKSGGVLYLGGAFASYRGTAANSCAKVDSSSGAQIP